jgi:hypothetical protein
MVEARIASAALGEDAAPRACFLVMPTATAAPPLGTLPLPLAAAATGPGPEPGPEPGLGARALSQAK